MSRTDFDRRFSDEATCAPHLARLRWPDGFVCPACGVCKGWELATKPFTWECAGCHRQTSVTAGTVMHRSKLPLRTWFEAIHLLTSHSNGISAEQAQAQLGIGSYKTAWLLLHKLRRAMVDPERTRLAGVVDESGVALRSKHDPIANHRVANVGTLPIIGAVEIDETGHPQRLRLEPLEARTGENGRGFVERNVAVHATVVSDGFAGYRKLPEHRRHVPRRWAIWRRMCCFRGYTGRSRTLSGGSWARSTACAGSTCGATSTSSLFAGTEGGTPGPPLTDCSG